jgi:hypothetical protein
MLERASAELAHRPDRPCDGRSHKRQRCFSAPILSIASASRFDWIGRFDGVHNLPWPRYAKQFRDPVKVYQGNIKQCFRCEPVPSAILCGNPH